MEMKSGLLVLGALLVAILIPQGIQAVTIQALTISTGINFQLPILRTDLFDQYTLDPAHPVIIRPSLVSKPSLPGWLKFLQPQESSDGYLYGTPQEANIGNFSLEIIALNSRTYESARMLVPLTVAENAESPAYLGKFFISNQNLADLFDAELLQDFQTAVNSAWGQESDVVIQSLTSARDLGVRVPLSPDSDQKFGVQVTIGAQQESASLSAVISDAAGPCQQGDGYTPPDDINGLFQPTFNIEWCNFTMTSVSASQPPAMNKSSVYLGGTYDPPVMPVEESDRFLEFLLLVVVPCAIVLCFILVLGYLMCCGRRGRKESAYASDCFILDGRLQLTHHRILRQASRELRTMSNRRDGTASVATLTPIGTPTVGSQRPHTRSRGYDEYPWASTPQVNHRGMATPPPYRTPPHPHKHRETSFSNQNADKRRLSEPSNARGEETDSMLPAPPFVGSSTSDRSVRPKQV